ncbi:hypothetical protein BSQ44_05375 [Aquibium oceanicum]|uniref:DUF3800 domain-containing protein n=1 Tax=Aquibium oceanicum TaxID=1670800 RepID=A0A1L3SYM2_9HYPH|nr:hypothetical protein BSQ44_05375 [Aquibium oceanicum]
MGAHQRLFVAGAVRNAKRAFIDDSGSEIGDRRLFLAGYLNRTDQWALFADAWKEELNAAPSIEYLHMVEAGQLRGQFARRHGWNEEKREEKLNGLARVIRHFEPVSFQMSIDRSHFYNVLAPVSPRGLANPYFTSCSALVAKLAQEAARVDSKSRIEFIFDDQDGVDDDIDLFFDAMMQGLSKKARRCVYKKPLFRSDRDFVGLQAADLLAWHIRREHEECGFPNMPMAEKLRGRSHYVSEIPNAYLDAWAEHHRQQPGVDLVRSKAQWRDLKSRARQLKAAGINPARATKPGIYYPDSWGFFGRALEFLRRWLRR